MNLHTLLYFLVPATLLADPSTPVHDWSSFAGDGTFSPPSRGTPLIEKAEDARLQWVNPIMTGVAKTSSGGYLGAMERGAETAFYGSLDNLIVADGKVFTTFTRPSGDVVADRDSVNHRYYSEKRKKMLPDDAFRIVADDVTVALDAETGERLWTRTEAGESIHMLSSKRGHVGISGAYGDGRFFAMGLMGRIYAYDADDGKPLWDHTLEDWHARISGVRENLLQSRSIKSTRNMGGLSYQRGGLVVAGDTLVAPDMRGGLLGLNAKTGAVRWRRENVIHTAAVPVKWPHNGKAYLITAGPGNGRDSEDSRVHLIDPASGESLWEVESGANPSTLVRGEDLLLLNTRGKSGAKKAGFGKSAGLTAVYRISTGGLKELWRFEDRPENHYNFTPDTGRNRTAVFHEGYLYIRLGKGKVSPHIVGVRAETGEIRHRSDSVNGFSALPYAVEDRLFLHFDTGHGGGKAGFYMYRLDGKGGFEPAGVMMFKEFDVHVNSGYELPRESPYTNGRFYFRATPGIAALDVRKNEDAPEMRLDLTDGWGGYPSPLHLRLSLTEDGHITRGRVFPPTNRELGVPMTTGRRFNSREPVRLVDPLQVTDEGLEGALELDLGPFSWQGELSLTPSAENTLVGTWTREIPALPEPYTRKGRIVGKGGWDTRGMPTPWLEHSPFTTYSELPEGWERMKIALDGGILAKGGTPKWFTLFLDCEGDTVKGGVGFASQFNQAWHEVDADGLRLEGDRITGHVMVVANPDPWWAPNEETGTGMAGRVEIDATRGEGDPHDIRGEYTLTWGVPYTRSGPAKATVSGIER